MPETGPNTSTEAIDLTNCDREPIHILGRVQSFGVLISVSSDWMINHASTNIEQFFGIEAQQLIGSPLNTVFCADAVHHIRSKLQLLHGSDAVERIFGLPLQDEGPKFDVALHLSGRSIVIEIEASDSNMRSDYMSYVRPMIDRIGKAESVDALCEVAARQLKALIGFDRVMVYRFEDDDSGTVIAEALKPGMESFKNLRYPASDIPKQARALYKRSLLRIISDSSDEGHSIVPATNPDGEPLDLSLGTTRAVSPIHLEYLRNMGVAASLSVSVVKRGKLWGLFACHHDQVKTLPYSVRTAAELFGQLFAFVLDQKEGDENRSEAMRGRILHDQLMAQIAEDSSISDNFETISAAINSVIPFDGVVGWIDGKFQSSGSAPTREEFLGLVRFLNTTAASRIYSQKKLISVYPAAEQFGDRAAGLLVLPVSRTPRDYMVLFRREVAQSVQWAGNPEKPVEVGPNGIRLTPRKSFEAWREIVKHQCEPWSEAEIQAAEALRITLLEVVLRMIDASEKERAKSQERQELLIAELNHRVRNILNLIRSLIAQTSSQDRSISDYTEIIGGRIHALARAHDQITLENWSPSSLHELIQTETDAYLGSKSDRVNIIGADPLLVPTAFTTLALVIHELVTNSAKYGALCDRTGSVTVELETLEDGALRLRWTEQGGPPIQAPPVRRGFGTTIIERSIPYELKGKAEVRYETTGLYAEFVIPRHNISDYAAEQNGHAAKERDPDKAATRLSGDVLLVEDNMIIAMDAEDFLRELGADTVHVTASVQDAIDIANRIKLSFALLDVNLGSETSEPVARHLLDLGVPAAFATGYGETTALTKSLPSVPVIQKPYDKAAIGAVLQKLIELD
jgi:light-regulated signal transduction histidine kinase (bacteriophytochrome)